MVLVTLPAIDGLKAGVAGGGGQPRRHDVTYWRRVGIPVLAPSLLGGFLLLFANAFSAFATAYALNDPVATSCRSRSASTSRATRAGRVARPYALAAWMVVIMAVCMGGYLVLRKRAERWQA